MIVTSFYSPEYAGEVEAFEEAAHSFGMMHNIVPIESKGSWRLNCGHKPKFLIDQLRLHQQPVLWVDIDGRFRREWNLELEADYDFAIWFIPYAKMRPMDVPGGSGTGNEGLASGTMWFNYTPMALRFLEIWAQEEHGQGAFEQQVLGEVWHQARPKGLRTYRLPQAYCKVFDVQWFKRVHNEVCIEHMQASRRLRKKVK